MNVQPWHEYLDPCVRILNAGGVILYPTDTVWGLGCNASDEKAVERIFRIKKRISEKGMIVLVDSFERLEKIAGTISPAATHYLQKIKGPTTVIYPNGKGIAHNIFAPDGSMAVRIVQDEFCKALIKACDFPIVSTSANFSGEAPPKLFDEIPDGIKEQVDFIPLYRRKELSNAKPSRVVLIDPDGKIIVLRE